MDQDATCYGGIGLGLRDFVFDGDQATDCNAPDPNKIYVFKRDILLNVLNVQIAT